MLKLTDLKELHSDTGEHELEQRCDDHDVPDGPDGHKHTLDHVLLRENDQMFRYKLSFGALDKSDFLMYLILVFRIMDIYAPSVLWLC